MQLFQEYWNVIYNSFKGYGEESVENSANLHRALLIIPCGQDNQISRKFHAHQRCETKALIILWNLRKDGAMRDQWN